MRYKQYQEKIQKTVDFFRAVFAHMALIVTILSVVVAATITMAIVTGMVYGEEDIPDQLYYGEPISYSANSFISKIAYEYGYLNPDGEVMWSDDQPQYPGTYRIRTVTKGLFGVTRYNKEHEFVISPLPLDVTAANDSFEWGEEMTATAATVHGDRLAQYTFIRDSLTSETIGVTVDTDSVLILNASGEDVTGAYVITSTRKQIRVIPREITVTVSDVSFVYNGTEFSYDGYEISQGSLSEGDSMIAVFSAGQTDVGSVENTPELCILSEMGEDISIHYRITVVSGMLTVKSRPLTIVTESAERVYDGSSVTYTGYTISPDTSLAEGQHVEADFLTLKEVTSVRNTPVFRIVDQDGADQTSNYALFVDAGMLEIKPRPLTVTTSSHTWLYDGTVHSETEYIINEDGLAQGQQIQISDPPTIQHVGKIQNVREVLILDADGNNVTDNYTITALFGELEVTPRHITLTTNSHTWLYDGTDHAEPDVIIDGDGLVEGQTIQFGEAPAIRNVGKIENTRGTTVLDADGTDVSANYEITTLFGELEVTPCHITLTTNSHTWVYDGTDHVEPDVIIDGDGLVEGQTIQFGEAPAIRNVGKIENTRGTTVLDADGTDVSANYEITTLFGELEVTPRHITLTTNSHTWVYDGTVHAEPDVIIDGDGLVEGQTIRFGEAPAIRNVGKIENTRGTTVLDADGTDVSANYEITTLFGELEVTPRHITLTTNSHTWVYDGTVHAEPDVIIDGDGLVEGHTIQFGEAPSIRNVGKIENTRGTTVLDADGTDVSANYEITASFGALEVTPRILEIAMDSGEWVYDGKEHRAEGFTYLAGSKPAPGQELVLISVPSILHAGTVTNVPELDIRDANGISVKSNYTLILHEGTLTVTKRVVNILTGSHTWMYDGTDHSEPSYSYTSPYHLAEGDILDLVYPVVNTVCQVENRPINVYHIYNSLGECVDTDYELTVDVGMLTVNKRPVTLHSNGAEKIYDGTPLSLPGFVIISDIGLADGHTESFSPFPEITDVGSVTNRPDSFRIYAPDPNGGEPVDVTDNYDLTFDCGVLTVTQRPVTLIVESAEKVYDGLPLKTYAYVSSAAYPIVENERLSAPVLQEQTEAGSCIARLCASDVKVTKADGSDSTGNYLFTFEEGVLTVKKRTIRVTSETAEKKYDGTPLTAPFCVIAMNSEYTLVRGHRIEATVTGKRTSIGTSNNTFKKNSVRILNEDGVDVTANYQIAEYLTGKLTVLPAITVTVTTASDQKLYDGTPLINHSYTVDIDGELPAGYKVIVDVTGEITEVGSTPNDATVRVIDDQGNEASDSVTIDLRPGTLTIQKKHDLSNNGDSSFRVGTVVASVPGRLYLRERSYGDYCGTGWLTPIPYGKTLPNGMSYNCLTSLALRNAGILTLQSAKFSQMSLVMIPYFPFKTDGTYVPQTDTDYKCDLTDYTVSYFDAFSYNWSSLINQLGDYAQYEEAYRQFVHENYLYLDSETAAYIRTNIIEKYGFDAKDPDIVRQIAHYVQSCATYNLNYDQSLDMSENVVVAFLSEYKEGVCRHYASAATVIFRALGIPARYIEGFTVDVTEANVETAIETPGHAWTEVYLDGIGWIPVEVTGGSNSSGNPDSDNGMNGDMQSSIIKLELTPLFQCKEYDGTPLNARNELVVTKELAELIAAGYTYRVVVSGQQTAVGDGVSVIEDFHLYDPYGREVTADSHFNFQFNHGVLRVYYQALYIFPYQISKYYDGKSITFSNDDFMVLSGPEGIEIHFTPRVSFTKAIQITISDMNTKLYEYFTWTITQNGVDCTDAFTPIFTTPAWIDESEYIPLEIMKCRIELMTDTVIKVFDETELTAPRVSVSKGTLADGDTLYAEAIGYLDRIGVVENQINLYTLRIVNADNEDVTDCYDIQYIFGYLIFTKAANEDNDEP